MYFKGLNNAELTEGKHSWSVTATDTTGNSGSHSVDFFIDRSSPNISEVAVANVSIVTSGGEYTLPSTMRMPSFSGKVNDSFQGSTLTNSDGSKDTFDPVSSGVDTVNLTVNKLTKGAYVNYLTQDYPATSERFYLTMSFPLVDGYYQVILVPKDKSGNNSNSITFSIRLNHKGKVTLNSSTTTGIPKTNPVANLWTTVTNAANTAKDTVTHFLAPTPTPTATQTSSTQPFNLYEWVKGLFSRIFHR
ncbi:MAG: hypothetical protein NTV98_02225 [Candidatus Roizmanbacteria bacterium]|nr:hypothetical protein [Candidatus Roizmanbacteria bacterium]